MTDEYDIYAKLSAWATAIGRPATAKVSTPETKMATVSTLVYINTIEGFWSLLRSWLRPHRGISQELLPIYLGFFEFIHNVRKRGKALLGSLLALLLN
jgi:transposase-like protein